MPMQTNKKTTALTSSVGADGGQSLLKSTMYSIPDKNSEINPLGKKLKKNIVKMQIPGVERGGGPQCPNC